MKTKTILITLVATLAIISLIFQSCKKDEPEEPSPPIYTNGQGEIGKIGGTIKIEDPSSPLNGASIVIPQGALESTVELKIEQPDSNYYINGSQDHILVDIKPSGIQFAKPVTIGIPYQSIENEEFFKPFYYNPETEELEELEAVELDKENKIYYAETEHTSIYYADEMEMVINLVKLNIFTTTARLAAYAWMTSDFEDYPTTWLPNWYGYPNAKSILYSSYVPDVSSNFRVALCKVGSHDVLAYKEMDVVIENCGASSSEGKVGIDQLGFYPEIYERIFAKEHVDKEVIANEYMSGFPLLFIFDEFIPNDEDEYYVRISWSLRQSQMMFTNFYNLGKKSDAEKLSEIEWTTVDINQNGIVDSYEYYGNNQAPGQPSDEYPSNNATNIAITSNLNWICIDPEDDSLNYDIYFGTSSNPAKVAENHSSTSYIPASLDINTTYYWKIKAFEVDNEDNYSESPVWQFTTGEGGGGTSTFTDPRDGQTYATVDIGNQTWMAENLNYQTTNSWWYENSSANGDVYGRLYTWEAALTACPSGWHLPTDSEWTILSGFLGGENIAGGKMKETGTTHWWSPNTGATNSSGFTALPGGCRTNDGEFGVIGYLGRFWSSTETAGNIAWCWTLVCNDVHLLVGDNMGKTSGLSVRCLKN